MKPGSRVHALIEIGLLRIYMPIEMNNAELPSVHMLRNAPDRRKAERMVSAEYHGKCATRIDMRHAFTDLIEGLLDIAGNGKYVADIADRHGFPQIHAKLKAVGAVQRRNLANALRSEPSTGAIGRSTIERGSQNGDIILAALTDIFDIGSLDKGVDPGEMRKFAAAKGGNAAIFDGISAR